MTNMKAYFRSHMRENMKTFAFILTVVFALTVLIGFNGPLRQYSVYNDEQLYRKGYESMLNLPVNFMRFLAYILPVMEFSFFKKRINLDCAYSMPISRRAMGVVHYLSGLITLFSAFTVSYLLNFAFLLSLGSEYFNFLPMLAHYILCLIIGFAMYSIMVFVFNEANTKGDGIWFMFLYTFVFGFVVMALTLIMNNPDMFEHADASILWYALSTINDSYEYLVEMKSESMSFWWQMPQFVFWLVFGVVVGIASAVGFFLTFGKKRTEKTGEVSDSFFGYRVLIPVYAISSMLVISIFDSFILWGIIELLTLVGYTLYRRGFHYKKSDIEILCLLVIFLFV